MTQHEEVMAVQRPKGHSNYCKCEDCKVFHREYMRSYRARKRGLETVAGAERLGVGRPYEMQPAPVTPLGPVDEPGPGPAETAVLKQVEGLSTAAAKPAIVELALAMARILDDPRQVTTQPSAGSKLLVAMAELERGAEKRQGRLAAVQRMSSHNA